MKKYILIAVLLNNILVQAQTDKFDTVIRGRDTIIVQVPTAKPGEKWQYIEQMPEAPYDIKTFFGTHMWYPKDAIKENIDGRVVIQFIVRSDGSIDSPVVRKSVYPSLDAEALRLICAMPPWKPGMVNGQPVRVVYTLPVTFRLE